MKKTLLILLLCQLFNPGLNAQNYFYFQTNGELPSGYDINKVNDSNATRRLLYPRTNNRMSYIRSFPFPFRFNNKYYANYRACDNGYISFNTGDTTAYLPDSTFSNRQELKNCIVPFWYDFELKKLPFPNQDFNVKVYAYTAGQYPNRTHTIQYYGLSKTSDTLSAVITNANVFAFAIVLHEGEEGRFDLIYNYFGKNNIMGLAGCSDAAGNFSLIKNQPIPYPVAVSSSILNTVVYRFYPGNEPPKKLYIKENIIDNQYPVNEPVTIKSRITNLGADTVYRFNFSYSVNGRDTLTDTIDLKKQGKALLPKGENTLLINASVPWQKGAAGSVFLIRTLARFNTDSLNKDTIDNVKNSLVLRILGVKPIERNTMLEISTGGWCGYCTSSHLVAETLKKNMGSKLIPIMHHFGDPMETVESNKVNEAYEKGYPYGVIDRKYFSGQSSGWLNIINIEKKDSSNVKVRIINKNFDEVTRKITFTVNVKCFDYLKGNYRIGAIISEDNVRGNASPSQWSQNNFNSKEYGASDSSTPLYYERRYMDGYLHHFVVLDMPAGAWGKDSSLPSYMKPDDEFNLDLSYTLPPVTKVDYSVENNTLYCSTRDDAGHDEGMFKPLDVNLTGFVAEYDETDVYKRSIINAASNKLLFDNTGIPLLIINGQLRLFPNPAAALMSFTDPLQTAQHCRAKIFSMNGSITCDQNITAENGLFNINTSAMKSGLYVLEAEMGGRIFRQKFTILQD